jgi:tetratricopeptide (TPR) repeat protein
MVRSSGAWCDVDKMRLKYIARSFFAALFALLRPPPRPAPGRPSAASARVAVRLIPKFAAVAVAVLALFAAGSTFAQRAQTKSAATEIGELMKAGRNDEALARADARLKDNPRDAQVRFMRGVILTEQGKTVEAALVFEGLIQEFPELPEPYNNLAVIRAAQGQYEVAYRLLQQALQAQPNYVTAYENLGDLYLSMAEQAYAKAAGLDAKNQTAPAKLAIAREMNARIREVR